MDSIGLRVTSLGVTTTQIVRLERPLYTWATSGNLEEASPLALAEQICARPS